MLCCVYWAWTTLAVDHHLLFAKWKVSVEDKKQMDLSVTHCSHWLCKQSKCSKNKSTWGNDVYSQETFLWIHKSWTCIQNSWRVWSESVNCKPLILLETVGVLPEQCSSLPATVSSSITASQGGDAKCKTSFALAILYCLNSPELCPSQIRSIGQFMT